MSNRSKMNIPFDVSYHFDNNLRDVPNSPTQMQQAVKFLQSQFDRSFQDIRQQIYLAGLIGVYSRMLYDFETAHQALTTALGLCARLGDNRLKIANSIRLANLYQWQQKYQLSEALLEEVLRQCQSDRKLKLYLDFAYQHLGKCKFDQGKYKEALHYFDRVLQPR